MNREKWNLRNVDKNFERQFSRFSTMNPEGTQIWYAGLRRDLDTLFSRWSIDQFSINPEDRKSVV